MASTKINGTSIGLYVSGIIVGAATSHSLSVTSESMDVTTKDSAGWKEILPTIKSWSIDTDALLAWDETNGPKEMFDALKNRTLLSVKLRSAVTGDEAWVGSVYVTSFEKNAPMEDVTSYSCSFEGTGELTHSTNT